MNISVLKLKVLIIILLQFSIPYSYSQVKDLTCKVLLKEISVSYEGSCKNGLADGKGIASGEDLYEGYFKNGLPEGKGVYTYKNGNLYSGNWKNGVINGKGKFTSFTNGKASVQSGYWKNGEYLGKREPQTDFRVNISGIELYSIKKTSEDENVVEISFEKDLKRIIPQFATIAISSGIYSEYNSKLLIEKYAYPLNCTLRFNIPIFGGAKQCNFAFTIPESGKYEVLININ